ncbi:SET domain-containing protein [Pleurotus eryngii]|uniref:SET domain-containing protein n=1 Tax=Pleurotus eryngii TaxID=5323 RepID=A0A9P6DFJ9_PLEER|nr:SET domain-containing protein [Pleurotus eryngii]
MPHTRGRSTSFLDTIRNAQTSSGDFKENVRQRNKTQRHSGLAHSLSRPALGATDSEPVLRGRRSNLGFAKSTHLSPCRPLDVPSSLRKSVSRSRSPFAPQERFPTPSHASSRQSSASRTGSVLVETELYDATFAEDFASLEIEPTLFAPSTFSAELLSLGDIYIVALLEPSVDLHIPPSSAVIPNASPLFRMVHSPASGYGLVATKDIEVGTTLLVEHPVVIIPHDLEFLSQMSDSVAPLLAKLPQKDHQEFMKLSNCTPFACSKVEGIVKTNTIPIELKSQEDKDSNSIMYHGVFIKASRCNHSCSPNAIRRWDLQTFSLHLEAVQPINPGEQITVHYVPLEQPRSERRAQLQELYHFTCQCDHCNVPDKLALAGDDIRQQLLEFKERFPSFGEWCFDLEFPDDLLIRAHSRALDLIKKEGLEALGRERHADCIAMCAGALADAELFTEWIQHVREIRVKRRPEQIGAFDRWLEDPTTFPIWNWRNQVRDGAPPQYEDGSLTRFFSPPPNAAWPHPSLITQE